MTITRHLLIRLRRRIRRSLSSPMKTADDSFMILQELTTGHRQPRRPIDPMKLAFLILLAAVLALFALGLSSCATVTTKTTVTDPATGLVTVTETTTTSPDAASVTALSNTAQAFAPRAVVVVDSGK